MTTVFENVLGMPIVEQNLLSIQKIPLVELPGQLFDKYIDITDSLFSKIGIDNASVHIERSNLLTQSSNINSCDLSIILSISSINGNIRIKIPESDFDILLSKSINKNYVPLISLDSKKYLLESLLYAYEYELNNAGIKEKISILKKEGNFESVCSVECSIEAEDVNIGFLLELSETFYADWNSKNSKKSLANIFENNEIADQIILDLSVIVGGAVLTKMDFIHLSEGDCILLNWGNWPSIKGIASLEMNDMPFLNAEIYGKTIKLGEFIMPEEKKNDIVAKGKQDVLKDNVKSITVTAEDILDNMDVIVKAEIASFKKNIKEVASLSSGNILPLETDGTIFLKVDGKIFAKGKMVRLGDSFGVQIISKSS